MTEPLTPEERADLDLYCRAFLGPSTFLVQRLAAEHDRLRAQVASLTAERDDAKRAGAFLVTNAEHEAARQRARADAAETTLKAVREAWARGVACGLDDSNEDHPTTPRADLVRLLAEPPRD